MGQPIRDAKSLGININPCTPEETAQNWQRLVEVLADLHQPEYQAGIQNGLSEIPADASNRPAPGFGAGIQQGMIIGPDPQNAAGWNGPPEVPRVMVAPVVNGVVDMARIIPVQLTMTFAASPTLTHNPNVPPQESSSRPMTAPMPGAGNMIFFAPAAGGGWVGVGAGGVAPIMQWGVVDGAVTVVNSAFATVPYHPISSPFSGSYTTGTPTGTAMIPLGPGGTPTVPSGTIIGIFPGGTNGMTGVVVTAVSPVGGTPPAADGTCDAFSTSVENITGYVEADAQVYMKEAGGKCLKLVSVDAC